MPTSLFEYRHEVEAAKIHAALRDTMDSSTCIEMIARKLADYEKAERARTERELDRLRAEVRAWQRQHKVLERVLGRIIDVGKWKLSVPQIKQIIRGPEQSAENAAREAKRKEAASV